MSVYCYKICFCFFSVIFFVNVLALENFVPSKETCGAAIRQEGQEAVKDNINHALACMIRGFKDVYWGAESELETIDEKFLPLEQYAIKKLFTDPQVTFGQTLLLLYTPRGEKNARLFLRMLEQSIKQKKIYKDAFYNEYLAGMLLGYSPEHIEHYYKTVIKQSVERTAAEKNEAEEFIVRETPIVQEEMRREKQRELSQQSQKISRETIKKSLEALIDALNNLYQQLLPTI